MRKCFQPFLLLPLLFFSTFVWAAEFNSDTCDALNSDSDFSVYFEIEEAEFEETVWVDKGVGGGQQEEIALWTDDPSVISNYEYVIRTQDSDIIQIEEDLDYKIWLTYESSGDNDKSGLVTYRLWSNGTWQYISEKNADLSSLNSVNIEVDGDDVEELSCSDGLLPPTELPEYSLNALYEFGTAQCNLTGATSCTIPFTNNYNLAPLVFVMPTIDTVDPDEDKPATLYISSELTADSTSVQITKDTINLLQMDNDVPITEVSYLIIEPGVASFNGHEVIAGYVDTNANDSKSHTGNSANVPFSDFGKQGSLNSPIVLHQIQTRNNRDKWMTSGKLLTGNDNNSARLFLELSASRDRNHNYVEERIAFIATNSLSALEVDGYNIHFGRGFRTPDQTGNDPMEDGCTRGYASIPLDGIDGIIGKKQERRGGHGGWARRCEIKNDNQVSFAIDEDFRDRTHLREELGYFAFEKTFNGLEICKYTPSIAQSNSYFDGTVFDGSLSFTPGAGNKIIVPEDNLELSFRYNMGNVATCSYPNGTRACDVNGDITYPDFPLVLGDYNTNSALDINCTSGMCTALEPGTYKDVKIAQNSILTLNSGVYYVNELNFEAQNATLVVNGPVELHYKKIFVKEDNIRINQGGDPNELLLIGHGQNAYVEVLGDNLEFYGYWYVDHIATNKGGFDVSGNTNKFFGGITAYSISMSGFNNQLNGQLPDECGGTPPSSNYEIKLTPVTDIALTCEDIPLTATVYKDDAVDNSFNGNITLSVDGLDKETKAAISGIATFDLSATQASTADAEVTTTIDGGSYSDTGNYKFVPYRFDVPDQYLIAMKPESVTAKVLACDSGNAVDVGYSGTPTITSNMVQPSSGSGTLTYAPIFSGGTSTNESSSIEFSESGQLTVTLIDTSFNCVGYDDCPIEGEDELTGVFTVNSRPWTFAICSEDNVSGGANGGVGYKESGEVFATQVKPIVWQTDGSTSGVIETSGYCGAAVTQNFFISDAPNATVEMMHEVATPLGGVDGQLSGSLLKSHDSSVGFYNYSDLSWDEVGSVRLLVDTQATYLEMDINQGSRSIGRFYPAFFTVIDTRWDYPGSQPHVYMGQPFDGVEFDVEALNSSNNAVQNYPLFDPSLLAKFDLYENSAFSTRLAAPALEDGSWAVNTNRSIGTFSNSANNDCTDSLCWLKQTTFVPDGPFNALEDIEVSNITLDGAISVTNIDPINYTTGGDILTVQPDIRFGRMSLKDVGGNQNTVITVPLTVEYWNGSRFITNSDDSSTDFDGNGYCHQLIWSDIGTDNASLSGTGPVSLGESRKLVASQSDPAREQVKFWLVLDSPEEENGESSSCTGSDNELPWLRYNWDGADTDEEDPSTVVTFGIHRGNDRVIYRGESGLIGQ
ncbi:DUF6701 domain-containing protein [Vibrio genomosp. F10]|uniref:DUF6701 domain-containing protein n=1 Tax=Vibrio genomosp. F10 TaxID=723171 RepID=UPI00030A6AB0|nr:DUF6701 domain-containing protein [Vibrio genomosp. F10]